MGWGGIIGMALAGGVSGAAQAGVDDIVERQKNEAMAQRDRMLATLASENAKSLSKFNADQEIANMPSKGTAKGQSDINEYNSGGGEATRRAYADKAAADTAEARNKPYNLNPNDTHVVPGVNGQPDQTYTAPESPGNAAYKKALTDHLNSEADLNNQKMSDMKSEQGKYGHKLVLPRFKVAGENILVEDSDITGRPVGKGGSIVYGRTDSSGTWSPLDGGLASEFPDLSLMQKKASTEAANTPPKGVKDTLGYGGSAPGDNRLKTGKINYGSMLTPAEQSQSDSGATSYNSKGGAGADRRGILMNELKNAQGQQNIDALLSELKGLKKEPGFQKTPIRTGRDNATGRTVTLYSDGTVE